MRVSLARSILSRMRRYLGMNCVLVLQSEPGALRALPLHPRMQCRQLAEREVLAFAADPYLRLDERWVRAAFARGAACLGALESGRLVAYTWIAFGDTQYAPGVWIGLDRSLRYVYKSFVRPEYRGRRIIHALHALAERPELWGGRRASVSFVDADNFASLAAFERTGARVLGHATYAKIFGAVIAFRSAGLRRAGISLYAAPQRLAADRIEPWLLQDPRSSA